MGDLFVNALHYDIKPNNASSQTSTYETTATIREVFRNSVFYLEADIERALEPGTQFIYAVPERQFNRVEKLNSNSPAQLITLESLEQQLNSQ